MPYGALAERVAVPEEALLPLPEALSWEEAAAFPVSFLTAYLALVRAQARPGEWVLVQAAAGALGTAAVQAAKALGLRVLGAASRPEKLPLVQALGADALATYEALPEGVRELGGLDLVLEVRGKAVEESLDFLKPKGRLVYIGAAEGEVAPINPLRLMRKTWRCWASGWPPSSGKGPFWRRPWASSYTVSEPFAGAPMLAQASMGWY